MLARPVKLVIAFYFVRLREVPSVYNLRGEVYRY